MKHVKIGGEGARVWEAGELLVLDTDSIRFDLYPGETPASTNETTYSLIGKMCSGLLAKEPFG